jgi:hypothetical protein
MNSFNAFCKICQNNQEFDSLDDFYSCRSGLRAKNCSYGSCATRERALASVLFDLIPRELLIEKTIYECSPAMRGLSLWLKKNCLNYHPTGFFPQHKFGEIISGLRNENLENLTLINDSIDVWFHLDVLEHLFDPFLALRETYRTLKAGGLCIFTAPTYPERMKSEQVASQLPDGTLKITGNPEYHGNPQNPEKGALVTWRYGYDLPLLIQRETGFDVEVRRFQSRSIAAMGPMTEVYICYK